MDFDFTFPAHYTIEEAELPADGGRIVYHPGASTKHGKDGSLLRFRPNDGREWIGCFAFGHDSYPFTLVFSSPNPDYACVISKGMAYWANAASPEHCQALEFSPVLAARALPDEGLLLLSDFITLCLMGGDGIFWRSPRLCWDELQIREIKESVVSGTGYDPLNPETKESEWSFDLRSRSVLKTGYPKELGML